MQSRPPLMGIMRNLRKVSIIAEGSRSEARRIVDVGPGLCELLRTPTFHALG
jgi:hypothetical protein